MLDAPPAATGMHWSDTVLTRRESAHMRSHTTHGHRVRSFRIGRIVSAITAGLLAVSGLLTIPAAANAAPNPAIVVDKFVIGGGTGPDGQLIVGDTVSVKGTWDAAAADPQPGDEFTIGLPRELKIPANVPFTLSGPSETGEVVDWATCLADAQTGVITCTLTEQVALVPESVHGEFTFDVTAVEATAEKALVFDLNGQQVPVVLPGGGGIDDGIEVPDTWSKAGEMNANNWSIKWTIDLPGSRMQPHDVINIADTLSGAEHALCTPTNLKVQTVRGSTVVDVTSIAELVPGADAQHFTIRLTAPEAAGFDADVTYRVTYNTCTPGGQIDPESAEYTNEATIDVWGESSGVIGVHPRPWQGSLTKSGTVLGGGERNGKIAWAVSVPGDQLLGRDGFVFSETLGAGHEVCPDTISAIKITERYGPSNQLQRDVTGMFAPNVTSSSSQAFAIDFDISDPAFAFKASDYRYVITYQTCVSQDGLPAGGTAYTNTVEVNGVVAGTETKVPGRSEGKNGSINGKAVTLDGVEHLPQTTLNWNITVPGERVAAVESDLVVTDTLSGAHEVCAAGDPTNGLASQLGLKVEARDQVSGGGLATVDLSDSVIAEHNDGVLTLTIPRPTLPQPGGGEATGFSAEYQYVIAYTTCTSSGGMDAPGTSYGNSAEIAGKTYEKSVTQNNRGSGTGQGVTRGSVGISKSLADTAGAAFVPAGTTFQVHVQEIDPQGQVQVEYDLDVPMNGERISGPNSRGTGWTVALSEPTVPSIPGVVFGDPVFASSEGVTVRDGGKTAVAALTPGSNITVDLTNRAQLGAVSLVKQVEGGATSEVDASRSYEVTAAIDTTALGDGFPKQADRTVIVTAGEPVLIDDVPIGATVKFSEARPVDDDRFTWGDPVFSPESVTVTAEHAVEPAVVTLTNTVERTVGTFSIVKNVTGAEADNPAVPDAVTVTAVWDQEGVRGSKTLTVPTDGTPVELGENLLIGTKVELTETPLEAGSGIAWGSPTWSGDGVTVTDETATVTIGRGAEALVSLENHAATSVAGISILKGLGGEAASEIDADAEFPVTATWTDAEGEHSKELTINAVEPTSLGVDLPAGTVVTITEGDRPAIDSVVWKTIAISGDNVTDHGDGSAEIVVSDQQGDMTLVTVVNEAAWAPGTFSIAKRIDGVELGTPGVPETVIVTASWFVGGEPYTAELDLPTDGTAVPFGEELPHGTEVTLAEVPSEETTAFSWNAPEWEMDGIVAHDDGTATLTIGAAQSLSVDLINSVTPKLGSLTVTKSLAGAGASQVPAGTVFPVSASWTDLTGDPHDVELELVAGEPTVLDDLPLGTEVTLTETEADLPAAVTWVGAEWSTEATGASIAGEGKSVVLTVAAETGTDVLVDLENRIGTAPGLAVTGGELLTGALLAAGLLAGGVLLLARRRRAL